MKEPSLYSTEGTVIAQAYLQHSDCPNEGDDAERVENKKRRAGYSDGHDRVEKHCNRQKTNCPEILLGQKRFSHDHKRADGNHED